MTVRPPNTAVRRWWVFWPCAVIATGVSCVAGYLIVGAIHHPRWWLAAYTLPVLAVAFAWSWAIQLLLGATKDAP